jgi:N-glycosylase/DNA lyase
VRADDNTDHTVSVFSFPAPERLARATEAELRACKMGFRAPYLLATARLVAEGKVDLDRLRPPSTIGNPPSLRSGAPGRQSAIGNRAKTPHVVTYKDERADQPPLAAARAELMQLPGVGRKIADCVLLFACGHPAAFPVDVWVMKALRQLYFPRRRVSDRRLREFSETHFGPHAGYAQQYLFHYMRTKTK